MAQITVREALEKDIPRLKELMIAYIVDFYEYRQPEDSKLEELIRTLLEQKEGVQFVAETEEGALVGFATLYFTYSTLRASKVAIMNDMFVVDAERDKGRLRSCSPLAKGIRPDMAMPRCPGKRPRIISARSGFTIKWEESWGTGSHTLSTRPSGSEIKRYLTKVVPLFWKIS
ncbi:hypothetical protein [Paenibacillus hexagrammi]|nr:hypothetical protein [Paenibacillus sp. YPD9-1]